MMVSAMISSDPLDEANEGMAADLMAVIAEPDCPAVEDICFRPAPADFTGIPGPATARSDHTAVIIDDIDRRGGGRSR